MSSGGQQPSAPQTPFSPNYRERRSVQSRGPGNAYTQRPGQQPNPQQPAQQLPPPPQQGNMQYDGGGYSTPFGGYGGFFEQYRTPFSGYGGGYGGGFSQPFALPQNPYQPPAPPPTQFGVFNGFGVAGGDNGFRNSPQQPPPGMEVNPNYQPSNRLSQDVRPSDMEFSPIQARTGTDQPPSGFELNPEYREVPPGTIRSLGPDSIRYRPIQQGAQPFVPDERQLGPAIQPNPGFRGNFSDYGDAMRNQGIGFGNPYGGYGAPYGGNPYMGMFGGLGSLFGGNGFQGMNQQARAQQMALENQRQFPQGSFNPTSAEEYYRSFNANTMTQSYKNPNYDPNNPDSERYITIS